MIGVKQKGGHDETEMHPYQEIGLKSGTPHSSKSGRRLPPQWSRRLHQRQASPQQNTKKNFLYGLNPGTFIVLRRGLLHCH
jgi:hypothetical protein